MTMSLLEVLRQMHSGITSVTYGQNGQNSSDYLTPTLLNSEGKSPAIEIKTTNKSDQISDAIFIDDNKNNFSLQEQESLKQWLIRNLNEDNKFVTDNNGQIKYSPNGQSNGELKNKNNEIANMIVQSIIKTLPAGQFENIQQSTEGNIKEEQRFDPAWFETGQGNSGTCISHALLNKMLKTPEGTAALNKTFNIRKASDNSGYYVDVNPYSMNLPNAEIFVSQQELDALTKTGMTGDKADKIAMITAAKYLRDVPYDKSSIKAFELNKNTFHTPGSHENVLNNINDYNIGMVINALVGNTTYKTNADTEFTNLSYLKKHFSDPQAAKKKNIVVAFDGNSFLNGQTDVDLSAYGIVSNHAYSVGKDDNNYYTFTHYWNSDDKQAPIKEGVEDNGYNSFKIAEKDLKRFTSYFNLVTEYPTGDQRLSFAQPATYLKFKQTVPQADPNFKQTKSSKE